MYNVLICDDQPDIVNALKIYLTPEGYNLFEAFTGTQAVEIAKNNDIHLILLDVMMPVMDGIEALTVVADHDDAGLRAARACAERWSRAGREVRLVIPPRAGTDAADLAAEENVV